MNHAPLTVAGIDVGGDRKGCHLVVLRDLTIVCNTRDRDPHRLARKCEEFDVVAVGIDSPCRWSAPGAGRLAERDLAKKRISSFATPSRARALASTSGFYGWMFNGERVYQALAATHPLLATPRYQGGRCSFETFPHAVCCGMLGVTVASAKRKRMQRRQLLEDAGIDTRGLKSVDAIDAALCASVARWLVQGNAEFIGDAETGYVVVPRAVVGD